MKLHRIIQTKENPVKLPASKIQANLNELNKIVCLDKNDMNLSGGITISAPTTGWLGIGFSSSYVKLSK